MVLSENDPNYRQCTISVMDNIADPNISFDEKGICNYYYEYKEAEKNDTLTGAKANEKISEIVERIKKDGVRSQYDCLLGVSGGVDSTYLALKAKELGLRVLCVHFDNGWNSELANHNIENIIKKCGFQLYTYVIDWHEFRDIQLAYFKAGVIDIEAITDIGINNAINLICKKQKIKNILSGTNVWTEQTLPKAWVNKNPNNLFQIHKRFGTQQLSNFPARFRNGQFLPIKGSFSSVSLLNYMEYDKKVCKKKIEKELGWVDYGGKHFESVFTRFYQGYILPTKFKVDKRKAHLSNLIFANQINKQEALEELIKPIYPEGLLLTDKEFVLKKLGFSDKEFETYLHSQIFSHEFYGNGDISKTRKIFKKVKSTLKYVKAGFKEK